MISFIKKNMYLFFFIIFTSNCVYPNTNTLLCHPLFPTFHIFNINTAFSPNILHTTALTHDFSIPQSKYHHGCSLLENNTVKCWMCATQKETCKVHTLLDNAILLRKNCAILHNGDLKCWHYDFLTAQYIIKKFTPPKGTSITSLTDHHILLNNKRIHHIIKDDQENISSFLIPNVKKALSLSGPCALSKDKKIFCQHAKDNQFFYQVKELQNVRFFNFPWVLLKNGELNKLHYNTEDHQYHLSYPSLKTHTEIETILTPQYTQNPIPSQNLAIAISTTGHSFLLTDHPFQLFLIPQMTHPTSFAILEEDHRPFLYVLSKDGHISRIDIHNDSDHPLNNQISLNSSTIPHLENIRHMQVTQENFCFIIENPFNFTPLYKKVGTLQFQNPFQSINSLVLNIPGTLSRFFQDQTTHGFSPFLSQQYYHLPYDFTKSIKQDNAILSISINRKQAIDIAIPVLTNP